MSAPKNLPASVKARLLTLAQRRNETFNDLVVRYCIERLLYRLGRSRHSDRFLLKGAMLFVLWDNRVPRPTKDLDFLGHGRMEVESVAQAFREIVETPVPPDGLDFDSSSIRAEEIREGQAYGGIRVQVVASLGTGRIPLQIDVGAGDVVTPRAEAVDFPVLLEFPSPRVFAYPVYTVVAEKFEAIVALGERNTRMKDFHDLWFLSRRFDFDGEMLHRALRATASRRGTTLDGTLLPFTDHYVGDRNRQNQWRGFLQRNGLAGVPENFSVLMTEIRAFLAPALKENQLTWRAKSGWQ